LIALIITITSFFWRLYSPIKGMDKNYQMSPKEYSKTLAIMIVTFIRVFSLKIMTFKSEILHNNFYSIFVYC